MNAPPGTHLPLFGCPLTFWIYLHLLQLQLHQPSSKAVQQRQDRGGQSGKGADPFTFARSDEDWACSFSEFFERSIVADPPKKSKHGTYLTKNPRSLSLWHCRQRIEQITCKLRCVYGIIACPAELAIRGIEMPYGKCFWNDSHHRSSQKRAKEKIRYFPTSKPRVKPADVHEQWLVDAEIARISIPNQ